MLIPLEDSSSIEGVPQVVKDVHSIFWWMLLTLLVALSVLRVVAEDVGGAFSSGLLALLVWCMVRDQCTKMTRVGCLLFMMVCTLQVFLDSITLFGSLSGRKKYTRLPSTGDEKRSVVTTIVETYSFFDSSQGMVYNLQSATLIAAPALVALGGVLAYLSFSAFPSPPAEGYGDEVFFAPPAAGGGQNAGGYYGSTLGGRPGGGSGGGSPAMVQTREGGQAEIFGGQGRRLAD